MTKKGIIWVSLVLLLMLPSNLPAANLSAEESGGGSSDTASSAIVKGTNALISRFKRPDDAPEWLKRTNIKLQIEEDYDPAFELETVQPLYQTNENDMFFMQLNARTRDEKQTYNLGLGYRNIVNDWLLLGVNSFYDYTTYYEHQRYGFGVEALGKKYEARANSYFRVEDKEEISPGLYQSVMNGYDVEVGGAVIPVKELEDLKIYAGYQWFNAEHTDDLKTYQLRATYPLTGYSSLEFRVMKNDGGDDNDVARYYAQLSMGLGGPINTKKTEGNKDVDLKEKLLQPVERVKDIVVEQHGGGFAVKIKRGN